MIVGVFVLSWITIIIINIIHIYRKYHPRSKKSEIEESIPPPVAQESGRRGQNAQRREIRKLTLERVKKAGKQYLQEIENTKARQRQLEWRTLQNLNNRENTEARRSSNGQVPLAVELRREERIRAHHKKWGFLN